MPHTWTHKFVASLIKRAQPIQRGRSDIELEHLQTESALLASKSVPTGTYNSLMVSFANPDEDMEIVGTVTSSQFIEYRRRSFGSRAAL
jgi:hypothetical protein